MDPEQYMSDGQYPHLPEPSQNDSGIFGTDGSDANHSTMSQKYSRQAPSERRYPEFPPSFRPKLHTSVSVEDHLGSDDILESIPFTSSRPTYNKRRYLPTHTLSQQEVQEWRVPYNVCSPASLSQNSHPPLRQQYLEGHHVYRKQTGSPASSDSSSCYNSANERLRSAPGSVISFPGSTFSSSTTSSLNSSRSGSKAVLPRPSAYHPQGAGGSSRHPPHHPSIPEFVRKTQSDVPKNFPQYHHRNYESESPEDDTSSMPNLPAMRKPAPMRPAPPPPHPPHRDPRAAQHPNINYRQKKNIERIPEEGRNRESLKMKLDMLIHVIKMFSSKTGKENDKDAANLLLALSRTAETVEVMHQSACLNMLIQIIHNMEHKDDREHHDVRLRATETLRNIVESKSDTRQGKHDLCVLSVLEKVRCHCDELFSFISVHPTGQRISAEDYDSLQASCDAVLMPIRKLYKYSNDKEKYRQSIINLGGLQAAAEVLIVNYRLLAVQKKAGGRHGEKKICHSSKIVTVIISILINLTCGDVNNKSILCACQDFLKALVYHVRLQNESIIASAAQVMRNLSWRATPDIKDALLYYHASVALMSAVDYCNDEATIQYITSALWNMSAHSLESRESISSAPNGILQLVNLLSYNSPSGTTSVVENVGGILKNLSVVIKDERYRKQFREAGGLGKLAKHLKSKNKTVLANATGILWNLSAHHYEDQKILWDLGCIPLLDIHRTSEHKSIRENARGALRNLLSFGQNNGWCSKSDVMGYNLKTQRGLSKSLSIAASYTFNHLIQPQSQKHSSESLNSKSAMPGRAKSTGSGHKGSTSSLSQPKSSERRHYHQHSLDQDDDDFGGVQAKPKNKDRLKFTRIASAPQSSSISKDMMDMEDEVYSYKPTYAMGGASKHSEGSYPEDHGYLNDHGYPEASEHHGRRGNKQDGRTGISPTSYTYSYSQEMHGLSITQLSNEQSDTATGLSALESKFDPHQPMDTPDYVDLEPGDEEDDIDQPIGRRDDIPIGAHSGMSRDTIKASSGTGNLALDGTSDETVKTKPGKRSSKV